MTGGQKSLGVLLQEKGFTEQWLKDYPDICYTKRRKEKLLFESDVKEAVVLWLTQKPVYHIKCNSRVVLLEKGWFCAFCGSYISDSSLILKRDELLADVKKEASK